MARIGESDAAVAGLLGFAVWSVANHYQSVAPGMDTLRQADNTSRGSTRQHLVDADVSVAIVAGFAAGGAAWLMQSWLPVVLIVGTFLALSCYRHSVLNDRSMPYSLKDVT